MEDEFLLWSQHVVLEIKFFLGIFRERHVKGLEFFSQKSENKSVLLFFFRLSASFSWSL